MSAGHRALLVARGADNSTPHRGDDGRSRLLRFCTDGCNDTLLYSAASEPIGRVASTELVVRVLAGIDYSLVIEQVA